MPVAVTYLGGKSIGVFMPTTLEALAAADAAVALPAADLQAQIAGAAAASASVAVTPPSFDLAAAIEGALQLPGVAVDASAMANVAAQLNVSLATLQAALDLIAALQIPFATFGVHGWFVEGEIGSMPGALAGQIGNGMPGGSGPNQLGFGVFLLAGDNGAVAALKALFAAEQ